VYAPIFVVGFWRLPALWPALAEGSEIVVRRLVGHFLGLLGIPPGGRIVNGQVEIIGRNGLIALEARELVQKSSCRLSISL
jgi:hypothetical protein